MFDVAAKILVFLLLAAAVGLVIGWWLARGSGRREVEAAERRARDAMTSVHADLQNRETKLRDLRAKMSDAEARIRELERQNGHLSTKRESSSIVDDEKSRIIRSLSAEITNVRQQSARVESAALAWQQHSDAGYAAEIEKITEQLRLVGAERDRLAQELAAAKTDIGTASNMIVELQPLHGKLQSAAARIAELEASGVAQRAEAERLQRELGVLATTRASLTARESDIETLKLQLGDTRNDLAAARQQLGQIAEYQAQANQALAKLRAVEMDLQVRDRDIAKLHAHLQQVERIAERVPELDRAANELKAQLSRANANVQASEKEVKARIEDLTRLRTELIQSSVAAKRQPELERQLSEALAQRTQEEERRRALEAVMASSQEELVRLRAELDTVRSAAARVPGLERDLAQSIEKLKLEQQRISALELNEKAHDATLGRMQTDLAIMQREANRATELERALQEMRSQGAREAERTKLLDLDLAKAREQLSALQTAAENAREFERELGVARTAAAQREAQLSAQVNELDQHARRVPELVASLEQSRAAAERERSAVQEYQQENQRLREQVDRFAGLPQRIEQSEHELTTLRAALSVAQQELRNREQDLEQWRAKADAAGAAMREKDQQIEALQRQAVEMPRLAKPAASDGAVSAVNNSAAKTLPKDDLKLIHGVGPVLEKLLNKHGIKYFSQVARWTQADIQKMSEVLPSFHSRIVRENWMKSAREQHIKKYGKTPDLEE